MDITTKTGMVKSWSQASHFSDRQIEYLALEVVKFYGLTGVHGSAALTQLCHEQLDEIWDSLKGFSEFDRVVMMTRPSGHPEVQAILNA